MARTRELSEAEQKARKKYNGMTRREYNRKHSKFASHQAAASSGSYEIVAVYDGNPVPQTAPFPNDLAAIARFERLSSNPSVRLLKVVKNVVVKNVKDEATGMRQVTIMSLQRTGSQEFANSKYQYLWRRKGGNESLTEKAIMASPALMKASMEGNLEICGYVAVGGEAWWERRL